MNEDLKIVVLPVSGYKAHLKKSITYGQHRALDDLIKKGMTAEQDDKGVVTPKISGEAIAENAYKTLLAWISRIEDGKGNHLGKKESVLDSLCVEDGKFIEDEVSKLTEGIKKK